MNKIALSAFTFFALLGYAQAQTLVAIPKDELNSSFPVPVLIELLDVDRSNFEIIVKDGGREVNKISVTGNINIDKVGTRFLAIDKNVSVITAIKNKKPVEEKVTLQLQSAANEPVDADEEKVQIGSTQFIFKKNSPETITKLDGNKFRFFVKSAQSKAAYVKKVVIELTKGDQKSLVVVNSTNLWWQPYLSIEGGFDNATIKDISFK